MRKGQQNGGAKEAFGHPARVYRAVCHHAGPHHRLHTQKGMLGTLSAMRGFLMILDFMHRRHNSLNLEKEKKENPHDQ